MNPVPSVTTSFRYSAMAASLLFSYSLQAAVPQYGSIGHLYTMSNAAAGNSLLIYNLAFNGALTLGGTVASGGKGTGLPFGTQGSLVMDSTGSYLLTVDAGTSDIAVFLLSASGATLRSRIASGGKTPVSLTVYKNLVYVLNAGGANNNITGFTLSAGKLTAIPNSTLALSAPMPSPAEVAFSADGKVLIVTEKNTNLIDTYTVDASGVPTGPITHASNAPVPFGFALASGNQIVVTEATSTTASSVSTYSIGDDGSVTLITGSISASGGAACWTAVSPDGEFAYTSNFDTASMSVFSLTAAGTLGYVNTVAVGNSPTDLALDSTGNYLFMINTGDNTIGGFGINLDRSLTVLPGVKGLPVGTSGMVIR